MIKEKPFKAYLELHRILPNKYGLGWTTNERFGWQQSIGEEIFNYLKDTNINFKITIKVYIDEMSDKEVMDNWL